MNIESIYKDFTIKNNCIEYLEKIRWKNIPTCPYCNSIKSSSMNKEKRYHCMSCNTSYSVTVGTIFHNTNIPLQKWFIAIEILLDNSEVSSRSIGRKINVNKDTSHRMTTKIKQAIGEYNQRKFLIEIIKGDHVYEQCQKGNSRW